MGKKDKKKTLQKTNSKPIGNVMQNPQLQKQLHQWAISSWLEGEKRLNQLENAKREAQRKGQVFNILEFNRNNGIGSNWVNKKKANMKN